MPQPRGSRVRALASRGGFLADIAHDLRTPLTAIRGFAELMLSGRPGDLSEEQRQHLLAVSACADEMLDFLQDLADLSAIETGRFVCRLEPMDLDRAVRDACEGLGAEAAAKAVDLVFDADASAGVVGADRTRTRRVLAVLVGYAVKTSLRNGRVEVSARQASGGRVRIEVTALGVGTSGETSDPFADTRAEPIDGPRRYRGPGLGLPFIKRLVEACGGRVSAGSTSDGALRLSAVFRLDSQTLAGVRAKPTRRPSTRRRAPAGSRDV